ncbi:hypothetical protein SAMN05660493_03250 [Epilithonimonas bovis DSM 19482]|uniref:AbiTii domain-containing protein n=1 Tax=Epilithonimonas bovis DSM 19482 TaxID=1121284 RepID=A0A1U7Q1C2_9FLAO|nr:hypothetical protein [Epilithonimonas bovis]SIT98761.1 hypothetical protein SAMN05660493_03250 [Epilithonimonas bovis DSM 19482]HBR11613.1 hypothetical protein [Chryseobacterium sp.]
MLNTSEELKSILLTVKQLLKADDENQLFEILNSSDIGIEESGYDNWNGGIYFYTIFLKIGVANFVKIRNEIEKIESDLLERFEVATRHYESENISNVRIIPIAENKVEWDNIAGLNTKENLLKDIDFLNNTMISVSTGGQRIQEVDEEYKRKFSSVNKTLERLNIQNPNPFADLWAWYGKWSSEFKTYQERRTFIRELYSSLQQILAETEQPKLIAVTVDLRGWERIERSLIQINLKHKEASTEEQFQIVGLLCRETIITLAQAVYNPEKHPSLDETTISKTDAKRMLESYIAVELSGSSNEKLRKYAKSTLDLANELTHKRTATKRDSSLCSVATISLVNFIGTIEGRI